MSDRKHLVEWVMPNQANVAVLEGEGANKSLYLKGIAIQGDVRNRNNRVYPKSEIERAVAEMKARISDYGPIAGECDHPDNLTTALERVSHLIEDVWMDGADGHAKFKVVDVGLGSLVGGLIKAGMRVGVSSRGSGNVDSNGNVSDFEIHTIDVVANPSAPEAYPTPILESIMKSSIGREAYSLAHIVKENAEAQSEFRKAFNEFLTNLRKSQG